MGRTRMEISHRESELEKHFGEERKQNKWLQEEAPKIRRVYSSFKLKIEGGHPRKWHLLHHWVDITLCGSRRVCIGCGLVQAVIRDDPDHSHEEVLGYINPNYETLKEPIDSGLYHSPSISKEEIKT